MGAQLDILALEPFYGGARRAMLTALMRCSRHRWTLLKLPPRRMERRLSASANWFAEQLVRHFSGHVDVLFTSEAMNLASLFRLVPDLATRPSVVYFHDNHLPEVNQTAETPFDLINLHTASVATEIWLNSKHHLRTFLMRAAALVARHPELSSRDPMPLITAKAHLAPPPMDLGFVAEVRSQSTVARRSDTIFVETRDANLPLLNAALDILHGPGREFRLVTVGPVELLSPDWERRTIREADDAAQVQGMLESRVLLSVKPHATSDYLCVRGALAGCRPVVPSAGAYPDLIPPGQQDRCLYNPDPASLAKKLANALDGTGWPDKPHDWRPAFRAFDAITACRLIDDRLEQLAAGSARAPHVRQG